MLTGVDTAAKCTAHSAQCTVHSAQYTAHSTQCTLHSAQCTAHSAQCTVRSTRNTVNSTQCTVHSAQHTVHSAHLSFLHPFPPSVLASTFTHLQHRENISTLGRFGFQEMEALILIHKFWLIHKIFQLGDVVSWCLLAEDALSQIMLCGFQ